MQQLFWPCNAIVAAIRSSKRVGCRGCSSVLTLPWHAQSNIILPCSRWSSKQQKQLSDHSITGCHPRHWQEPPISCMWCDGTMQDTSAWRRHHVPRQPQNCGVLIVDAEKIARVHYELVAAQNLVPRVHSSCNSNCLINLVQQ